MSTRKVIERIQANWPGVAQPQMTCLLLAQRVARLARENAQEAVKPLDLSFTEFEVLAALRSSPPPHRLHPTDLYDAMLISSGGLTKVLKGLEARGIISRPAGEGDQRRRPVALEPEGVRLAEVGLRSIMAADTASIAAAKVSDAEIEQAGQTLLRLAASMESFTPEEG